MPARSSAPPRRSSGRSRAKPRNPRPDQKFIAGRNKSPRFRMLPLRVLDRLLASKLVPREAKLSAIERWQLELADLDRHDRVHLELGCRLAEARLRLSP